MTTTSSNNFTGLYGGSNNTIVPTTPYGNANVVGLLSTGTDGANTVGNVLASGNVTGVYFIGDGSLLTNVTSTAALTGNMIGNIAGNGFSLNNIQTESIVGNLTVGGNIRANTAGTKIYANSIATTQNIDSGATVSAQTLSSVGPTAVGGDLSVVGNILTGGFADDINLQVSSGAALDLPSSGNVLLTAGGIGNTSITILGNLRIGGNITYPVNALANITTSQYFKGDGSLLTNLPAGNYNNANVSTFLAAFGSNTISTTGNVTAGYFLGNGSQLTGLPATYGNANVAALLASFGSNSISTTGNVTAGYVIGNGSLLTSLTGGNVTGTVANATYAVSAGSATTALTAGTVTDAAQPNITSVGTLTSVGVTGNITGGNILTNGLVSAAGNLTGGNVNTAGNITGSYFIGNGSQLTGIASLSSTSNTQLLYNQSGAIGGSNNLTFNLGTANLDLNTLAGNINMAGLVYLANNIRSTSAVVQTSSPALYRITMGSGYNGLFTNTYDPLAAVRGAQLLVQSKYDVANTDTNQSIRQVASNPYFDLQGGTLNNANRRMGAGAFITNVGNGTMTLTTGASVGSVNGAAGVVVVGNAGSGIANATSSHGAGLQASVVAASGGTIGNAFGIFSTPQINSGGNITNLIATSSNFSGTTGFTTPTTAIGYYMPGTTATYGISNGNGIRAATNYYFLRNDDPVAQNQLGSLRSYTEYDYINGTSGSLTIDKNNGQVQQIDLTGNVTGLTFSNFVTSASDSVNTDYQVDTVTLIFNQGATGGYGVIFPASSSTVKYAGNITSLQSTAANSVSLVSVSAANIASATTYLITISPGFV